MSIMLTFRMLFTVLLALCALTPSQADVISKEVCFFGRWDLRQTDKAITVNSGSYVRSRFTGAEIVAVFDMTLNADPVPTIAWQVDGGKWNESYIASRVVLAAGLSDGPHTLMLMVRGLDEHQSRWFKPLVASVTFLGFELPKGGKVQPALHAWKHPKLKLEFLGDSITEGGVVQNGRAGVIDGIPHTWPWLSDARMSYVGQTAMALRAEWRQVGFGATGLLLIGSGDAPGALAALNFFYDGCPRDAWQPDVVIVNQGTNEPGMAPDTYIVVYQKYLIALRRAYPNALLVGLRPFNGTHADEIRAAINLVTAIGDKRVQYMDSTGWYDGDLHPDLDGSTLIAKQLVSAITSQVLPKVKR